MRSLRVSSTTVYQLILLFLSIEYLGLGQFSVFRVFVFPLSVFGIMSLMNKPRITSLHRLLVPLIGFMIFFSWARMFRDDNWINPLLLIFFLSFILLYNFTPHNRRVDHSAFFSFYSLPHILAWITRTYNIDSGRFAGYHQDPNFCALFLMIGLLGSLFLLFRNKKIGIRLLCIVNVVLSVYLLFLSGSRGALVSLFLCLLFVFCVSRRIKIGTKIIIIITIVYAIILLLDYIMSLPDWVDPNDDRLGALLSRMKPKALINGANRAAVWSKVINQLRNPIYWFIPLGRENAMSSSELDFTHNTYLDILVEAGGLIGLVVVVIIFKYVIKGGLLYIKGKLTEWDKEVYCISLAVFIQLFTLSALTQKVFWLFVILLFCFHPQKNPVDYVTINNNSDV